MRIKMLSFLLLFACMHFVLFVRVKSSHKKNKEVLNYPNTLIYITTYFLYYLGRLEKSLISLFGILGMSEHLLNWIGIRQ